MSTRASRCSSSQLVAVVIVAVVLVRLLWSVVVLLTRGLAMLFVAGCWSVAQFVAWLRDPRGERAIIRRRLGLSPLPPRPELDATDYAAPHIPTAYRNVGRLRSETWLLRAARRAERAHERELAQLRRQGWTEGEIRLLLETPD